MFPLLNKYTTVCYFILLFSHYLNIDRGLTSFFLETYTVIFFRINLKFRLKILFLQQLNINILMIKQRKTYDGMLKWLMLVWKVLI